MRPRFIPDLQKLDDSLFAAAARPMPYAAPTLINLGNHDSITLANAPLSALHASDFIVH